MARVNRPLRVWHMALGRRACLIAAPSKAAAARGMGVSVYCFNEYAGETGNADDIALATSRPGVLFVHTLARSGPQPWVEARTPHDDGDWA